MIHAVHTAYIEFGKIKKKICVTLNTGKNGTSTYQNTTTEKININKYTVYAKLVKNWIENIGGKLSYLSDKVFM